MAENNLKSPDIMTVLAYPNTNWDACQIVGIFLDCTGYELPFSFDMWQRTVKTPTELYFVFEHKKQIMSFIRRIKKEFPDMRLIF